VVSRDDEHRNASIGYSAEWLERLIRECGDDPRPIEDVTRVHHEVDLAGERRLKRRGVVGEEIVTTPAPVDARSDGEIEAEMGIGQKEDSDVVADQSSGLSLLARRRAAVALTRLLVARRSAGTARPRAFGAIRQLLELLGGELLPLVGDRAKAPYLRTRVEAKPAVLEGPAKLGGELRLGIDRVNVPRNAVLVGERAMGRVFTRRCLGGA
jgi:hypothetical protein